jgi:hypothetical protein
MKTISIASFATSLLLTTIAGSVLAQTNETPRADKRQARQEARIEKGKATGALNDKEAARLEAGQDRVEAKEAAAKADGTVTKKEKAQIENAQDRQSRRIARQKHDGQTKPQ